MTGFNDIYLLVKNKALHHKSYQMQCYGCIRQNREMMRLVSYYHKNFLKTQKVSWVSWIHTGKEWKVLGEYKNIHHLNYLKLSLWPILRRSSEHSHRKLVNIIQSFRYKNKGREYQATVKANFSSEDLDRASRGIYFMTILASSYGTWNNSVKLPWNEQK